jgi:hypothetical protein
MEKSDTNRQIDIMYSSYMAAQCRNNKKRKHPSRQEFGAIMDFIPQFKAIIDTVEDAQREERINQSAPY